MLELVSSKVIQLRLGCYHQFSGGDHTLATSKLNIADKSPASTDQNGEDAISRTVVSDSEVLDSLSEGITSHTLEVSAVVRVGTVPQVENTSCPSLGYLYPFFSSVQLSEHMWCNSQSLNVWESQNFVN